MNATPPTLSRRRTLLIRRLHRRKSRERERLFVTAGTRGAQEALGAQAAVRFALRSPRLESSPAAARLGRQLAERAIETIAVDDATLAALAGTDSPQGILLVCEQARHTVDSLPTAAPRRILLLDALQDPGNLGALVRTAAAFGLDAVVALDGCVDPWNPKAVRATAGAIFRIPVIATAWREIREWVGSALPLVVAASTGAGDTDLDGDRWALVVGNEGAGVRAEILARATHTVAIPIASEVESLNAAVAGGIVMYALCGR